MAYSDFTLEKVAKFGLKIEQTVGVFDTIPPTAISSWLRETLDYNVPLAQAIGTEKARSELIIAPVLVELKRRSDLPIIMFSGIDFRVDESFGLVGVCDFLINASAQQYFPEAPILAVVEAKRDDLSTGYGQCAAIMLAALKFHQQQGRPLSSVYGVVTTGVLWQFFQLRENTLCIESTEYSIREIDKVMGILKELVHLSIAAK